MLDFLEKCIFGISVFFMDSRNCNVKFENLIKGIIINRNRFMKNIDYSFNIWNIFYSFLF